MFFVLTSVMMCSPFSRLTLGLRVAGVPMAGLLILSSSGAYAQGAALDTTPRRTVSVVPRISVTETLTDNVRLTSTGQQSDQITEISPGIRISSDVGRLKGYFDYSLSEIVYAQNSSGRQSQNALTTFGTLEAVDNWAYLDFSGSISQQAISAFGTQSSDNTSLNANRTEVSTYRLSPYVRGRLGGVASYEARYSRAVTTGDGVVRSGVTTVDGNVKISGGSPLANLGWSADASQQSIDYSAGRSTEADRVNIGISVLVTPQFTVFANAGREANNYTSFDKQSYGTSGFGVSWSPSQVTKLSALLEHRAFGDAHSVSFEHRTARTAWKFTDTLDVSATPNQTGIASLGSIYDILFSQFASIEPDPVSRAQLVNAFLVANGISPSAIVATRFLTSAVALQRRQDLTFALLGVRDTLTFILTRGESSRLDTVSAGVDDFSTSSVIRQRGYSVNYAHRLTPEYSLGVLLLQQNTSGDSTLQDTKLQSLYVNLTGKVSKRATASVGVRRVAFSSSGAAPYTETALIGNLTVQF